MGTKVTILVIEDEMEIRELLALHLSRQGFEVKAAASVAEAELILQQGAVSLITLDWMLPGMNGVDFLKKIRAQAAYQNTPVFMITAKSDPADIILGLESGADDFLVKPFLPNIFIARVKALLRRVQVDQEPSDQKCFDQKGLKINFETYECFLEGELLNLTPSEFKLLTILVKNDSKAFTRNQLIDLIQGEDVAVVGRTIDTHVFGLRKKLGFLGDCIETVRGIGYRFKMETDFK